MPSSLACSWAHLWVLGKLSAGSTPCTTIEKALSGQLPCVPYLPRDFPVPANKPVLSWLHLILLQEPLQPGSTGRILQIRAACNLLPLCASPIPKDTGWVLPRTFLLCLSALGCLRLLAPRLASVEAELWGVNVVYSSLEAPTLYDWFSSLG